MDKIVNQIDMISASTAGNHLSPTRLKEKLGGKPNTVSGVREIYPVETNSKLRLKA